ncbi:MAG: phosphopantothenoylcysteine decarboxylase [Planctomycetota bacterium]
MRILITAGPTREYLDDVRFLSNASTGRMGCALARAAAAAGHRVVLVHGPLACEAPECDAVVPVVSAADMCREVIARVAEADAVVMAAAVADYRPAERVAGKIRKGPAERTLRLAPTPDIAAEIGRDKGGRVHVGFALEAANARANARRKLREKNFDLIVLNSPAAIGADRTDVELLFASGEAEPLAAATKDRIAGRIIAGVEQLTTRKGAADGPR